MLTRNSDLSKVDFIEGSCLLINKPIDWTSFDVVNKIRFKLKYFLDIKKIKVGHAGTLDPLASGLLILCTGKFTKKLSTFQDLGKTYTGTMVLGQSTPTYDAESEPDHQFDTQHINDELIQITREKFLGWIDQVPPIYSAVKIEGRKAYDLARRGKDVALNARKINIKKFEIDKIERKELNFKVECSKGTYIRSLIHDFGKSMNSGAYLSSLTRTKIGEYDVSDAFSVEEFVHKIDHLGG